jgi:hypothetical protein
MQHNTILCKIKFQIIRNKNQTTPEFYILLITWKTYLIRIVVPIAWRTSAWGECAWRSGTWATYAGCALRGQWTGTACAAVATLLALVIHAVVIITLNKIVKVNNNHIRTHLYSKMMGFKKITYSKIALQNTNSTIN